MTVRVRIAPSPTGAPHVGTAYMALFNYVFARHYQGQFILRIEDTDQSRSRLEYETNIFEALNWAGLKWDEGPDVGGPFGPYRQSERSAIYKKYCQQLLDANLAYKCFATEKELQEMRDVARKLGKRIGYDRRYRNLSEEEIADRESQGQPYVIRLKVPLTGEVEFHDEIRGRITFPCADIDDQILLKSDGMPTYHLANVVDDHLMKITHVIRGDEWVSSTPKHILLYQAFGWEPPKFIHMPLLLGTDGKKLSKRRNPTSIFYYRDSGYLPEAFRNFLSLMGYSMPEDKEVYDLCSLEQEFDIKRIGTSGAVFDIKKLDWLNQQYLVEKVPQDQLWQRISEWGFNDDFMGKLMPLIYNRIKTFGDFFSLCSFFFVNEISYNKDLFVFKNSYSEEEVIMLCQVMVHEIDTTVDFDRDYFFNLSKQVSKFFDLNHKKIIMPILFGSIMGKHQGPPFFDSLILLGKDRARVRFLKVIEFLGGISIKKSSKLIEEWQVWKEANSEGAS